MSPDRSGLTTTDVETSGAMGAATDPVRDGWRRSLPPSRTGRDYQGLMSTVMAAATIAKNSSNMLISLMVAPRGCPLTLTVH